MSTLYEVLGVAKTATKAAITKEYRRMAKAAHPDVGGSVEAFTAISNAYRILTDDAARAKYDETGTIDDASRLQDVRLSKALSLIGMTFEQIVSNTNILEINLPAQIISNIKAAATRVAEAKAKLTREITVTEKALKRLARTKHTKQDYLATLLQNRIDKLRVPLAQAEEDEQATKLALDLLDQGYTYTPDPAPMRPSYSVFRSVDWGSGNAT